MNRSKLVDILDEYDAERLTTTQAVEAILALSEATSLLGDLTTPFEPCGVYLATADILEFVTEDAVVVVRSITPDLDVLLSVDRSRVLGFQVNGASTFGERLALQPRAEEWRPINEAPKDGMFLAATADGRMMIWRADLLRTAMAQSTPDHLTFPATHFRPLPPPPKPEVER